jgi:CheY-like chemotaxis protein
LHYDLSKGLPSIEADASQIQQVVMNLIINASEAIGEETGIVNVTTGVFECDRQYISQTHFLGELKEGCYVYLEVVDSGRGMDSSTLEKIFDPFFSTKFTGRGLGLAAVLGIVRGHQGALIVQSELGRGTSFKVLFPAASESTPPATMGNLEKESWKGSGTVLLVDDEAPVIAVARRMLERMGFSVLTAEDGYQALETVRARGDEIQCVILDLTMPRMDGEETFRELQRINPELRIIMTSGFSEQEVCNRFMGRKISGFVHKPYQLSKLTAVMKALFDG